MTVRPLITATAAMALLSAPISATAQDQQQPSLPQELSGLSLSNVTERMDDDDREIRATLDGTMVEITYDDGRLEDIQAAPGSVLPQAMLEAMVPQAVRSRAAGMGIGDIREVEFDDDGEIELYGMDGDGPVEATFTNSGQMLEFERRDSARSGPPDHAINHDIRQDDVRRIAGEAGYGNIGWIEIRPNHVAFDATNPDGEPVEVRLDDDGRVVREERR